MEQSRKSRGRPHGYNYLSADWPILIEMAALIDKASTGSMSPNKAAYLLAHRAIGSGSLASKQHRLLKAFVMNENKLR